MYSFNWSELFDSACKPDAPYSTQESGDGGDDDLGIDFEDAWDATGATASTRPGTDRDRERDRVRRRSMPVPVPRPDVVAPRRARAERSRNTREGRYPRGLTARSTRARPRACVCERARHGVTATHRAVGMLDIWLLIGSRADTHYQLDSDSGSQLPDSACYLCYLDNRFIPTLALMCVGDPSSSSTVPVFDGSPSRTWSLAHGH